MEFLYVAFPTFVSKWRMETFTLRTSETGTALSTEEAQHLREEVRNTAELLYRKLMIEYVTNNLSSFPEYSTNTGADVSPDKNAYYNGMNLERPDGQGSKLNFKELLNF
jgi:hypothetical protein